MIPVCFEYVAPEYGGEKVFITILDQFTHHFTGEKIFRVRIEGSTGWVANQFHNDATMRFMIANRVEASI